MQEHVRLQGDPWRLVDELPRPIAESWRRLLERFGVPSMLRTPWQWVQSNPVLELEAGSFQGLVGLYVPEVLFEQALEVLGVGGEDEVG